MQFKNPILVVHLALLACVLFPIPTKSVAQEKDATGCYQAEFVSPTPDPGHFLDVAMSEDRIIHVVHLDGGAGSIHLTQRINDQWADSEISPGGMNVSDLEIAVDPTNGKPSFVYVDAVNGHVLLVDPEAGIGATQHINPGGPFATRAHLTYDDSGLWRITYFSETAGEVWLAMQEGSSAWTSRMVGPADGLGGVSLATNGFPYVVLAHLGELTVYHDPDGHAPSSIVASGVEGLGTNPGILITENNGCFVAWSGGGAQNEVNYSRGYANWITETVSDLAPGEDPELSIAKNPFGGEFVVTYLQEGDRTFVLVNRNFSSHWHDRRWPSDASIIQEAVSAPHSETGLVMAFRTEDGIEIHHQEVVPAISANFHSNPAVGGELVGTSVWSDCADRKYVDGQWYTMNTGGVRVRALEPRTYDFAVNNGFAIVHQFVFLDIVPFDQVSFWPSENPVILSEPVTLHWNIPGADDILIEPGGLSLTGSEGSVVVYPTRNTDYTLVAENLGYGTTSTSTRVNTLLFSNPSFTVTEPEIVRGMSTLLEWSVTGADSILIEPGGFVTTEPAGSLLVKPTDSTTYTMTAINSGFGELNREIHVHVDPLRLVSFTTDSEAILVGEPVTLAWQVMGTATVELQGYGNQPLTGSLTLYPEVDEQFVLTADWEEFHEEASLDVGVVPELQLVASFLEDEIATTPPAIGPGDLIDIYIHWRGPARSMKTLEFGIDLPSTGIYLLSSETMVNFASNYGTATEWQVLGSCFFTGHLQPIAKLTLIATGDGPAPGAQITLRGLSGGSHGGNPWFEDCDRTGHELEVGPPLPFTGVVSGAGQSLPKVSRIQGIYPNPFNPRTTIGLELEGRGDPRVAVYDMAGRLVRFLDVPAGTAGTMEIPWDGKAKSGEDAASGVYLFRLEGVQPTPAVRGVLVR